MRVHLSLTDEASCDSVWSCHVFLMTMLTMHAYDRLQIYLKKSFIAMTMCPMSILLLLKGYSDNGALYLITFQSDPKILPYTTYFLTALTPLT